ncbi:PAS domain-containing sensor histidine kinase [Bradymonas sediminis]|uniref:histidine kinase n=1 Tax=Bradymonas sediminis TaxID=1548548 RepID=A0A2Z4FH17_9DELT|nr:ATP-binding protein [Bradymonas sediminis]AWV88054.1 hypothetical protein DN745_01375 [Bradymonas sediminis]TDP77177.1 PAS domain S-box-containing protein [Bradymonas sediminis]
MPNRLPSWERTNHTDTGEKLRRVRERVEKHEEFFWVFDPKTDSFIYIGGAYTRIWERSRAELTSNAASFFEAIHPDDRERIRRAYSPDRAGSYDEVYRVLRADGTMRIVRDRAFPHLPGQHRVEHLTGIVTDITDPKDRPHHPTFGPKEVALPEDQRSTIRISSTQNNYRNLFLEAADAIMLFDGHGYVIEANHHAAELFGFERHELTRMHFSSFFEDRTLASAVESWERVRSGLGGCKITSMLRKDRQSIEVEIAATLLFFGHEYIIQASIRPVSSQEQIAHELEAARDQLAQVQKMELIGQIAGGAAHDFNNLLSVITGFAEVIKMRLDDNPEAQRDTEKILEAGESAALLVRRLLTLARPDARTPEVLAPREPIMQTCALCERAVADGVTLQLDIAQNLWAIRIDRIELEQIIMNLVINASDAMPEGGVVELEVTNFSNHPTTVNAPAQLGFGRYLHLRVRDSGIGMDEGIRARIFEPFFSTKPCSHGTGLGLATVKNLVSRNRGFLTVESEPDQGTTFDLYFPMSSSAPANTPSA